MVSRILLVLILVVWSGESTIATNILDNSGTEFILGLLGQSSAGQTKLQLTSNVSTHVSIEAPFIGLSVQRTIQPGTTYVTSLDSSLRETGSELSFKGLRVTSDQPIAVHVLDDESPDVGGYMALPTSSLGIDYIVTSFESREKSELLIISANDQTKVTVHLKTQGRVVYHGNIYVDGEVITRTLDTYQTLQLESTSDLTGTLIKADGNVAVFSGGACAVIQAGSSNCGFVVEQMLPVETWKSTYVIPSLASGGNRVRMLARDDYTNVRFAVDHSAITVKLNTSEYFDRDLDSPHLAIITSNRPISVSLVTGNDNSTPIKPSMTLVPAVDQFDNFYRFKLTDVTVYIIVPTPFANGVLLNNQLVTPSSPAHVHIPTTNQDYTVFHVKVTGVVTENTLSHMRAVPFGAVVYGIQNGDSFSFPIGMRLDLSSIQGSVQLVGGTRPTEGRVEYLYQGRWGTICGDNFDHNDANVVCRMLGFNFGSAEPKAYLNAHYGPGGGAILVDNLQCDGTETELHLCQSGPWGNTNCPHSKDAGVDCGTQIQLVGTNDSREGRLQVYYNNQWGTVCDDNFGRVEAEVVCNSLGYGTVGYYYTGGGGTGPQWIDDVTCSGEESDIAQCMVKRWGVSDCTHAEDVWVACYPKTKIRLAGGSTPAEGRLEVAVQGRWASVCDNMFGSQDAVVVCNMLGYELDPVSVHVVPGSSYGKGSGQIAIDELQCSGSESDIADCPSKPWLVNNCTHYHDVGMVCGSAIRLVDGTTPNNGRLQVYYKSTWGTVCDDGFDALDAQVVCRQLGYPYGLGTNAIRKFGQGTGNITIDELQCRGTETDIAFCNSNPWMEHNCRHSEDIGIDCGTSIRLVGGTSPSEGRVEVYHNGQWGTVCDNNFDVHDADVICDNLGFKFNMARKVKPGVFGQGTGPIVIDQLQCTGNERDLQFCLSDPWGSHSCTHAEDVGVDCGLSLDHAIKGSCTTQHWDITVDMRVLARLFPNAKSSDIQLGLQGCQGVQRDQTLHFTEALSACGTVQKQVGDKVVYTNEILYAQHDPNNHNIIRNYNWSMTFTCNIGLHGIIDFQSVVPTVVPDHTLAPGSVNPYKVAYGFYVDVGLTNPLPGSPLQLRPGSTAYVKLYTTDADSNTKMVVQDCYATGTNDPKDPHRVVLLDKGCAKDTSTTIIRTDSHVTVFSFRMFDLASANRGLFIHCDERFCPITDYTQRCSQSCHH